MACLVYGELLRGPYGRRFLLTGLAQAGLS